MNNTEKELELDRKADAMRERLTAKAIRAVDALTTFEKSFDNAKSQKTVWKRMCDRHSVCEDSNIGDWMC